MDFANDFLVQYWIKWFIVTKYLENAVLFLALISDIRYYFEPGDRLIELTPSSSTRP